MPHCKADWGNRQPLTTADAVELARRLSALGFRTKVYRSGYGEGKYGVRIYGLDWRIAAYYNCRTEQSVVDDAVEARERRNG